MARSPNFAGLILAAGESTRMGRDKALLPWKGKTFLAASIDSLAPHTELVIVVGGKNSESLKPIIYAAGAYLVVNPCPQLGQFSSLQTGVREILNRGRDAAILTLVDRPPARRDTVEALRQRFLDVCQSKKWAVVPEFNGRHGHPIVIGREMIEAFLKTPAHSTARDVMHSMPQVIDYFPVSDPTVAMDIDTPEQYEQLRQQ